MKKFVAAIAGLLFSLGAAHAASFNCVKAKTQIEKMICSDPELSKLDDELASTYKQARQAPTDWEPFGAEAQKAWLAGRNKCYDSACLIKQYREHIHFWKGILDSALKNPPIAGTYQHPGWCVTNFGRGIADEDKWGSCEKGPVNTLQIKALESGEYAVSFEFTGFASTRSYCRFAGIFDRTNDVLQLSAPYKALACKMKIRILKDKFVFEDEERSCHDEFCDGTNQSINQFEFEKTK